MLKVHMDGTIEVGTPAEAAELLRLMNGHHKPAARVPPAPEPPPARAVPPSKEIDDATVEDLLRAGGIQLVRAKTRKLYGFLLRNQHRAWTAEELSARLGGGATRAQLNNRLSALCRRNIVQRVGHAQYKAQ
jgi:hypothetical protein